MDTYNKYKENGLTFTLVHWDTDDSYSFCFLFEHKEFCAHSVFNTN